MRSAWENEGHITVLTNGCSGCIPGLWPGPWFLLALLSGDQKPRRAAAGHGALAVSAKKGWSFPEEGSYKDSFKENGAKVKQP